MASKKKKNASQKANTEQELSVSTPWISKSTGLKIIILLSLGMFALTIWEVTPHLGLGSAILYGLLYVVLLVALFFGLQLFFRWIRR